MKTLILGLGSIGMRHARCFQSLGVSALAGFDPTESRRQTFAHTIGGPTFETESDALAWKPELVVVASPNIFHLPQAMIFAGAGIPLFIEKPLGTDLEAARQLEALVQEKGLYTHVGSNWKFHPAFQTMKRWVDDGKLGRITGIQVLAGQWLPDWHPWEDYRHMYAARKSLGGGAIFDTHELDYMTWLLGPVTAFHGFKAHSQTLDIETEDVASCTMMFERGALGTLLTDYIQRTPRRSYHISGSEGTLEWSHSSGIVAFYAPQSDQAEQQDCRLDDINDMYVAQARHVLEDIATGRSAVTPVSKMLRVLELQSRWHHG